MAQKKFLTRRVFGATTAAAALMAAGVTSAQAPAAKDAPKAAPAAKAAPAKAAAAGPLAGQTVRIAHIDPFSGPFANVGQNQLKSWQFVAERYAGAKNPAGVTFEVKGFDNKGSPQESLNALNAAIGEGFRYVTQGNGSGAAAAIIDAVNKHNERNPGKEVVYVNYAAVDPALTNERCSFWHFRLDGDTSMKMEALTSFMKDEPKVKNVYLINQNYSHGQQVARYFKEGIARKRPDVKIAGEELHPLGQVRDFAPYVAKIRASGADAIVTGNWGTDMTLLVKALNDAGLTIPLYAYYAGVTGTPTALSQGKDMNVSQIAISHSNFTGDMRDLRNEFKKRFNDDFYTFQTLLGINMLAQGMANAKSTDPVKVAQAMSGMTFKGITGEVTMRKTDHQLQQPMYISKWTKATAKDPYSEENTGFNFAPVRTLDAFIASTPTSCQMKRP
jgi:branched-chain amino acid transport system substrate-binding protein